MSISKIPPQLVHGYWKVFDWFAAPGQKEHPVRAFRLHAFLLMFTVSQTLMVLFAVLGLLYIHSPVMAWGLPPCIALAASGLFSYRFNRSMITATNIFLAGVTSYVFAYCWVDDGFRQITFAWFALIPLAAGMLTNHRVTALCWSAVTLLLCGFGFWASLQGHTQYLITEEGYVLLKTLEQSGFFLTAGIMTWFKLTEKRVLSDHLREKAVAKQNLLRILAHDISNPLSVIRISSQFLAEVNHIPETRGILLQMDRSSLRISDIIQLIRDMEGLEGKKKRISLVAVSLRDTLTDLLSTHQHRLDTKGIRAHIHLDDDPHVMGHPTMLLEQVLGNVLVNAIKFSPPNGEIHLRVTSLRGETEVAIVDGGIGIPSEHLPDLFDPLSSQSRRGTAGETGHGHGLSIAKTCLKLMGGSIRIESQVNAGTTVKVKLLSA